MATDIHPVLAVLYQNIVKNSPVLPAGSGSIEVRELDWTVPPKEWTWTDDKVIASHTSPHSIVNVPILGPPFELIVTSDTIYSMELIQPLFRTLHGLCVASLRSSPHRRLPVIYVCVERRESTLIDNALAEAKSMWAFKTVRISQDRILKATKKGGIVWNDEDWGGVEIWKMMLDKKRIADLTV